MTLKTGKMTTKELAQWFGIAYSSFRKNAKARYETLSLYCDFEQVYGGAIIHEVYLEKYDKNLKKKDQELYMKEVERCIAEQNGLSTVTGMARKYVLQKEFGSISAAKRRLTAAGKELFGETKELISHGSIGSREYVWAIKEGDYNQYRFMTEAEEQQLDKIIATCYSGQPEKIKQAALLEDQLRKNEIDVEEYFTEKDRLNLNTFMDCVFQFREETGCMLVRCTRHEIEGGNALKRD